MAPWDSGKAASQPPPYSDWCLEILFNGQSAYNLQKSFPRMIPAPKWLLAPSGKLDIPLVYGQHPEMMQSF
jgi:hypothetical protein